jgi:transaldolase
MSNLHNLASAGQSVWIDSLSREILDSGELQRQIDTNAVTGVTSNPTIFAKAMLSGTDYDAQLAELVGRDASTDEIYTALVTADIQKACDVMLPVFDRTRGADGFVSVEVAPGLAHDTDGTIAEARDWAKRVDRPNLLVKVPATAAGVPAVRRLISEGISINVTLIFSLDRYEEVMEAYIAGLESYADSGGDVSKVASVASFFVSRVDSEVDGRLDAIGTEAALALRGEAAVANARVAYLRFLRLFSTDRWLALAARGARAQQPLWASTSTKNPAYSDILYVATLVAPTTVNTMPESTIEAYQDHGPTYPDILDLDQMAAADASLAALAEVGIDYDDVTDVLEREGVEKFIASFDEMIADIDRKREALLEG